MSGQTPARWRARTRFLAVPVAALVGMLVAVPLLQPAGASPVTGASHARAAHAGPPAAAAVGDPLDITGELQKALLKFAGNKLAGFGFNQLGLDKLLGGTQAQFDEFKAQLGQISGQIKVLQDSVNTISTDISKLTLNNFVTDALDKITKIESLYINDYAPAVRALATYVSAYLAAKTLGQTCAKTPDCAQAETNYHNDVGVFLLHFATTDASSYNTALHNILVRKVALADYLMSAYGTYLAKSGTGFLNDKDSAAVQSFYNYFADYEALAAWMLAQYKSVLDVSQPGEFDIFLNEQIYGYQAQEHKDLPPPIPPGTVIVLPKNAVDRTDNTTSMPMWGAPNTGFGLPYGSLGWWDPYSNATGVPALVQDMNTRPEIGWGFQDWRLPSRAELDALLARGPATQSAREFLFSINPGWDRLLSSDLDLAPYIWTTQPAGVPSWDGSPEIPCKIFNALAGDYVTITTFKGYLHTAVGPVTNSLSGYPANYKNYNRPAGSLKEIIITLPNTDPLQKKLDACKAILNNDIAKATDRSAGLLKSLAATLTLRSTGAVNYLP